MATILLLDSNPKHRNSIALTLGKCGHKVITIENDIESHAIVDSKIAEADVVLAETINADEALWKQLAHICNSRCKDGMPPLIVCSAIAVGNHL